MRRSRKQMRRRPKRRGRMILRVRSGLVVMEDDAKTVQLSLIKLFFDRFDSRKTNSVVVM